MARVDGMHGRQVRSVRLPAAGPGRGRAGWVLPTVDAAVLSVVAATQHPLDLVAYVASIVGAIAATGGYRPRLAMEVASEIPRLAMRVSMATVALVLLVRGDAARELDLVHAAPVAIAAIVVGRALARPLLQRYRSAGAERNPTLVIGAGNVGVALCSQLRQEPSFGLNPIGFLDAVLDGDAPLPAPILGAVADLPEVIAEHGVRNVIIAFGRTREVDLVEVIRACERHDVTMHLVPRLFELRSSTQADQVGGIPLIPLQHAAMGPGAWWTKRAFDAVLSAAALVVLAPVLGVLALLVRASSPGPVLFRQRRVGQDGRLFDVLKFRTMEVNDDSDRTWSVRDDPRVTTVGRFMRRTSLDELPQFLNVLRGDMSLVGPRPERPAFDERYRESVPRYGDRLRVPVGLTGLAQVQGLRGNTSIADRVWFDNRYIEDWSLWRDVTILVRTVLAVLRDPERGSSVDDELAVLGRCGRPSPTGDVLDVIDLTDASRPPAVLEAIG
jgi:exopolysaccharide biosynthesis polyprenyl glycosylphosphotransferase